MRIGESVATWCDRTRTNQMVRVKVNRRMGVILKTQREPHNVLAIGAIRLLVKRS